MTFIRRTTQLTVIASIALLGVFLALESTDLDGNIWRTNLADGLRSLFNPGHARWQLAVVGAGVGLTGVMLIAAQLTPARRGISRMLEVGKNDDGATRLTGRAAMRSVEHELSGIEGVTGASAVMPTAKKMHATIRVDDRCDLADVEQQARHRLDTPFWLNLGIPDVAIDLTVEFDPKPPRVR